MLYEEKEFSPHYCRGRNVTDVEHFRQAAKLGVGYARSRSLAETRLAEIKTGPKVTFDAVSAPKP